MKYLHSSPEGTAQLLQLEMATSLERSHVRQLAQEFCCLQHENFFYKDSCHY